MATSETADGDRGRTAAPASALSVERLSLSEFRCYRHLRLDLGPRPVVLSGVNGAGKTNVLEALSFLVPGRGLRGARLSDVARRSTGEAGGAPPRPWAVAATVSGGDGPVALGTGQDPAAGGPAGRRLVHVDGAQQRGQAALAEHISAQWLTPQMDRLFTDGPHGRRRFLDRLVFAADPAHAGRVQAYEHAMRERIRLLTQGDPRSGRAADPEWLSALEETMAAKGVAVASARIETAHQLAAAMAGARGAFPAARIAVVGELEGWLGQGPALEAEDRMRAALKAARRGDGENGSTAFGPHRGDLAVRHGDTGEAAEDCSTGQQKALLISLILANARLQAAARGRLGLLLLDEIAAHLDHVRLHALFDEIAALGVQAWMTGTDIRLFAHLAGRAAFFEVDDARIRPVDRPF